MAGVVLGASLAVGGLGIFVWNRTEEANRLVLEAMANASASIEADNQRRLEAAERERALAAAAALDPAVATQLDDVRPLDTWLEVSHPGAVPLA